MTKNIHSKLFLYFLPVYYVYNMLIDVLFVRGSIIGVMINIFILLMMIYFSALNIYNKFFSYIHIWILYNLILIFCNSSDVLFSLIWFSKNVIGLLCFPLAFYYISTNGQVIRFFKILVVIMLLYIVNLILANTLDWGKSYGGGDSEYAIQGGASLVTGSMPVIVALMIAPVIFTNTKKQKLFIIVWSVTIICVPLIFKRTNIAALIIGYLLFFILYRVYQHKIKERGRILNNKNRIKMIIGFLFLLSVLFAVFRQVIIAQFEYRSNRFNEGSLEKEGRIIEWELVKMNILYSDDERIFLFGKEPYNTSGNYGLSTLRNIHGDFSMILFSTGTVGFIAYWSMQIYIALLIFKYNKKRYLRSKQDVLLFVAYLSSSVIWFIFCFSATLGYVLISAVYYMIHGMIVRYFWNKQWMERNDLIKSIQK